MRLAKYRGKYCVYWRDPSGQPIRRSLGTDEVEIAKRRFEDFKLVYHARKQSQGLTVNDWWVRKVEALGGRRKAENMGWSGRAILPFFGHLEPRQVTDELCKEYIAQRQSKGRKNGTIHTELSHLQSVLSFAKATNKVVLPPRPPPKDLHLTKEQVRLLMGACNVPHIRLFILLAISTGGRTGAILDLT